MDENSKGYKGFSPGLVCKGKQYAENTVFEENGGEICRAGMMHYCTRGLDVLQYYPPVDDNGRMNEYARVEAQDEPVTDDGCKYATRKLHVAEKISFGDLVRETVAYDMTHSRGNSQTGNRSGNSQTGNRSGNSQTGYCSYSIQTGARSASVSTGDDCRHQADGEQCIAVGWGKNSMARGALGSYIVLAEYCKTKEKIKNVKMAYIDGQKIKADTWYKLVGNKFVECDAE